MFIGFYIMANNKFSNEAVDALFARVTQQQTADYNPVQVASTVANTQRETAATTARNSQVARENDHTISTDMLESNNPFVWAGANAWNTSNRAWATVAHAGTAISGGMVNTRARSLERGVPADVKAAHTRIQVVRNSKQRIVDNINAIEAGVAKGQIDPVQAQLDIQKLVAENAQLSINPADFEKINSAASGGVERFGYATFNDVLEHAAQLRSEAGKMVGDRSKGIDDAIGSGSWWNQTANKQMMADIQTSNAELLSANPDMGTLETIGKLTANTARVATDSPKEIVGMAAESLLSAFSKPAIALSTVGDTSDFLITQRNRFNEKYDRQGTAMTSGENLQTDAAGLAFGALNFIGDMALNKALQTVSPAKAILADTATNTATNASKSLFARVAESNAANVAGNVVNNPITRNAGRMGAAMGQEYVTEGLQSVLEDSYGHMGSGFNTQSFAEGGTLGALAAGVMTAPSTAARTVNDIAGITRKSASIEQQLDINDTRNFNPVNAMAQSYRDAEPTTEGIQTARDTNKAILTDLTSQLDTLLEEQRVWNQRVPQMEKLKTDLRDAGLDLASAQMVGTDDEVTAIQEKMDSMASDLTQLESMEDGDRSSTIKHIRSEITKASNYHTKVTTKLDGYDASNLKSIQASQAIIEQPSVSNEDMMKAIADIVSFPMMASPNQLQLAANALATTDPTTANKLRQLSQFKASQTKNTIAETSSDVADGSVTWRGMTGYADEFDLAYATQDTNRIAVLNREIESFQNSMDSKAKVAQELLEESKNNNKAEYTMIATHRPDGMGLEWRVKAPDEKVPDRNFQLKIQKGESDGLVYAIGNDAWLIGKQRELQQQNQAAMSDTPVNEPTQPTTEELPVVPSNEPVPPTSEPIDASVPILDTPTTEPPETSPVVEAPPQAEVAVGYNEEALHKAIVGVLGTDHNPQYIQDTVDYVLGRELADKDIPISGIQRTAHVGSVKAKAVKEAVETQGKNKTVEPVEVEPTITPPPVPVMNGWDDVYTPAVEPQTAPQTVVEDTPVETPVEDVTPVVDEQSVADAPIDDEATSWGDFTDPTEDAGYYDNEYTEYADTPVEDVPVAASNTEQRQKVEDDKPVQEAVELPPETTLYRIKNGMDIIPFTANIDNESANEFGGTTYVVTRVNLDGSLGKPLIVEAKVDQTFFEAVAEALGRPDLATYITEMKTVTHSNELADAHETEYMDSYYFDEDTTYDELVSEIADNADLLNPKADGAIEVLFDKDRLGSKALVQVVKKGGVNPLQAVKNFLYSMFNQSKTLSDLSFNEILNMYVHGAVTSEDSQVLSKFYSFMYVRGAYNNQITADLIDKVIKELELDNLSFVASYIFSKDADGNTVADENVKTAIGAGIFNWVAANLSNTYADNKSVGKLLDAGKDIDVHGIAAKPYRRFYGNRNMMINSVGQDIAKALGLKAAKGEDATRQGQLETSLGMIAYRVMVSRGLVNEETTSYWAVFKDLAKLNRQDVVANYLKKYLTGVSSPHKPYAVIAAFKKFQAIAPFVTVKTGNSYIQLNKLNRYVPYDKNTFTVNQQALYEPDNWYASKVIHELPDIMAVLQEAMTLGSGSITFVGNTLSNEVYKAQKGKRVLVGDDALSPATRSTFGELTGFNNILSRLFGVKAYQANPLLEAAPFEQSSIKGTLGKVPDALAKALDKIQQLPVVVKPFAGMLLGIAEMDDKALLNAVLGIDESLLADAHVSRVDSIRATNLATERDFTNAQLFLNSIRADDGTYPHIFHKLVVWSNHRIGIASTTFNFQASKIARAMSTYAQSAVEIVRGDDSIFVDGRKLTHYGALLHGVAVYAEGVTKSADYGDRNMKGMATVDKGKNKYILQAMHEFTTQKDFKQAAAAILKLQASKPLDDVDIRSISAVVARMDGGIQSFEALVELVTFINLEKGEKFTSYLTVESDGITNGIAINQIQNGTATIEMLQQFGIIPMGNDAEDFFSLKENGLTDYYETVGSTSAKTLKTVTKNLDLKDDSDLTSQNIADAIKSLDPDFGGRAGGKKAGTPDNYGAGASRLAEAAALDGYASIIKEIEKAKRTQNADRLVEINIHIDNIRQLFNKRFAQVDTNSNATVLYEQMLWEVKNELRNSPEKEVQVLLKQLETMPVNTESVTMAMTCVFNTNKLIKARAKSVPTNRTDIIKFLRIYHDVKNYSKNPVVNFNGATQVVTLNNALTLDYEGTPLHAAILKVFSSVQGGATVQALQKINEEFYTVRTANIALTAQAYKMYDVLYKAAVRNAIDIKIRKGLITIKPNEQGVLVAEEYLTRQDIIDIERSISKYLPTGDTFYSGQSKNKTSSGIIFIDTADAIVKGERFDQVAALPDPRNPSAEVPTVKLGIKQPTTAPISLAGNSSVTQSIDAATSIQSTIANIDNGISALNFHDSNGFNILNVQEGATAQNKAFLDVLMDFSTQDSFLTALLRPLQGLNTLNEIVLTTEDLAAIEAIMANSAVFFAVMQQAEHNKLALLSQMKVINQYGTENGTYVIDEATRNKIDKAYNAIQNGADNVSKTINMLMNTYKKVATKKPTKHAAYNKIDFTTGVISTSTDTDTEVDETIANPIIDLITDLGSSNINGNDLIDGLLGIISNDADGVGRTKLDGHYTIILSLIRKVLDSSITVNLFTRNNIPAHVTDADNVRNKAVKGWYSAKSGQINIMYDPEMSSALIVHELLHAVVSSAIRAAFHRKKKDGVALPIGVASMLYIFTHLKNEIGVGSKVAPQFAEAMSNLDEFISYALTSEEFMVYLHTVKMPKRFTAYTQDKNDDKSAVRLISRLMENVSNTYDAVVQAVHRILGGDKLNAHNKKLTALEAVLRAGVRLVADIDPADYSNKDHRVFNSMGQPSTQVDLSVTETIEKLKSNPNRTDKFNKQFTQEVMPLVQKFFDAVDGSTLVDEIVKEADVQAYWDAAVAANRTPYSSSIRNVGIPMDDQEMLAVEALEAALNNVIDKEFNSPIYRTIEALYKTARTKLSPADFYDGDYSQATQMDTFFAERQYNAVFGASNTLDTNGRNHYLTRFMALAVGSEFISSKLAQVNHTPKKSTSNLSVFQTVQQFIENTLNSITEKLARTGTNKDVRSKMLKLIQQLKDIEYKSKKNIFADIYDMAVGSSGGLFNAATGGVRSAIQDVLHAEGVVKSPFTVVRFVGSLSRTLTSKHLFDIGSEMIEIQNREKPGAVLSEINQIANEFATPRGIVKTMQAVLAKNNAIQQQRERLMEATKRNLNYLFEVDGIETTQENMTAVTNVLLRTGLSVLVQDGLTLSEIRDFVMNDTARKAEIKALESSVIASQVRGDVMVQRTLDLAAYSVNNKDSLLLAKNTTIIASEIGFNNKRTLLATDDPLVQQLNTLHALYALGMVKPSERILVQQMVVKGKAQDNAVDAVLRLHNDMTQVAKRDLFKNNEMSMAQTYIPEITNTNRDIQLSISKEQDKYLEQNGYSYVSTLGRGYGLSSTPVKMYYSSESNGQRYVDAALSITNPSRKGTQVNVPSPRKYEQTSWAVKIAQVAKAKGTVDPMLNKDVFVIPSYDTENNVIAYSYEMHGKTRDELLERNSNVIDVLALYTGSNLEKVNTKAVNKTVADALYEDWDTNYMTDPKAFVRISPNETDKKLVEIYRMIPKETRDYMVNKFGGNELYVRNAVMNSTFGYRKYAMTEMFDKEAGQRNTFELGYVAVMEGLFRGNARNYTAVGQRAIMEIVAKVKDAIIIRNLYTLVANVVSNFTLLSMYGVNPVASAKHTKVAVSAGLRYKKDLVLLLQAKQQLAMGVGNALEINRTIRMYQDAIDRNPLKEFIDAGMMSAIVEDVSLQTDKYSLESKFMQKYAGLIDVIPQPIQTGFNWMMISPQTPIHAFLSNTTALSDFAAKYTLYMHNTAKGMSKEEALFESNEAFINYDVPTSKAVQFANDIGLLMFTKYYYRIQRVIVKLTHERPAAMLVHAIVVGAMLDLPTVFDSFAPNSLGFPLHPSLFMFPAVVTEPLPMSLIFS